MVTIATMGFGEAATAFVPAWLAAGATVRAYDIKTDDRTERRAMRDAYARHHVIGCDDPNDAVSGANAVLSLVTAGQALAAARNAVGALAPGALWLDLNSVAPATKQAAAGLVSQANGRYADVAVMGPVDPARSSVPLLVSGPYVDAAIAMLSSLGFSNVRGVVGGIGAASAIKMIRSVMIKGLEALTTECVLAAESAGVTDEVIASLDANWPGADWARRANYDLERMLVHGTRRAAEMEEAVRTLDALGTGTAMTRGTVECHRALGALGLSPPAGLGAKLDLLLEQRAAAA